MLKSIWTPLRYVWLISLDIFCYVGLAYLIRELLPMVGYSLWMHPIYLGLIFWALYMIIGVTLQVRRRRIERAERAERLRVLLQKLMDEAKDEEGVDGQD
jgi:hypothetical protein